MNVTPLTTTDTDAPAVPAVAPPEQPSSWANLRSAPLVLQAYLVFTVAYACLTLLTSFVPPLGSVLVPYLGGSGMLFAFTLYFAFAAAVGRQRKIVYAAAGMLGFITIVSAIEIVSFLVAPNPARVHSNNPYLVYHDLRPAFSIVLPLAWMALLLSPSVMKWASDAPGSAARRGNQFSIADLLYLTLIVCLALAASLGLSRMMRETRARLAPPVQQMPHLHTTP